MPAKPEDSRLRKDEGPGPAIGSCCKQFVADGRCWSAAVGPGHGEGQEDKEEAMRLSAATLGATVLACGPQANNIVVKEPKGQSVEKSSVTWNRK